MCGDAPYYNHAAGYNDCFHRSLLKVRGCIFYHIMVSNSRKFGVDERLRAGSEQPPGGLSRRGTIFDQAALVHLRNEVVDGGALGLAVADRPAQIVVSFVDRD